MIYLDHHACAPLSAVAREAMAEMLRQDAGNPSSVHGYGRLARGAIERARGFVATSLGASARAVVFTSGGTEAVHLAVRGISPNDASGEIWLQPGAHSAMVAACELRARELGMRTRAIPCNRDGEVSMDEFATVLAASERALVALTFVQHETGAITNVRMIADEARRRGAVTVVDAVQALGKVPVDVGSLGAAAVAVSAHKIGGPGGVGAVWSSDEPTLRPLTPGGGQERGLRSGTENLLGIVGFGAAASRVADRLVEMPRIASQRDRIETVLANLDQTVIAGAECERVATVTLGSVRHAPGDELVAALDLEGIAVSSGSACASGKVEISQSLRALFADAPWRAECALRISLGVETSESDVDRLVELLPGLVERVRRAGRG